MQNNGQGAQLPAPLIHKKGHNLDGKPLTPMEPGGQQLTLATDGVTCILRDWPALELEPVEVRFSLATVYNLTAQKLQMDAQAMQRHHPVQRAQR
jgi:hypothetical protein